MLSRLLHVALALEACAALSVGGGAPAAAFGGACSSAVPLRAAARARHIALQLEDEASSSAAAEAPPPEPAAAGSDDGWWTDDDAANAAAGEVAVPAPAPAPPPQEFLKISDLENTRWDVVATPREDSWLNGPPRQQEFTLLGDQTVVWGGSAGGFGTGGRWNFQDGLLEVIRTTPLGLVTGRDYYMSQARVAVGDDLKFELKGIIRSYNALQPVMVIADFVATRRPGRFVRDVEEE